MQVPATHTWGTQLFPEKAVSLSRYDNPPFPVIERAIKLVREGRQPGRLNSYTGPSVALLGQLVQIWGETQGGARRLACPGLVSAAPFGAKRRREGAIYQRLFTTHRGRDVITLDARGNGLRNRWRLVLRPEWADGNQPRASLYPSAALGKSRHCYLSTLKGYRKFRSARVSKIHN